MQTSTIVIAAVLMALCVSPTKSAEPTLADGTWIVIERCGENPRAPAPDLKRPFDRRTELTVRSDRIAGHDRTVTRGTGAVTNVAYDGKIEDGKVAITGSGTRSDTTTPWTYTYEGTVTIDGHAELTGGIFGRVRDAADPVKLRTCSLSFVGLKEPAKP